MAPSLTILCALLSCAVLVALAAVVVILFNAWERPGRWWRFHLGRSRNKRREP